MKLAILADYPVSTLAAIGEAGSLGHHATWLPRISRILEGFEGLEIHWIVCTKKCEKAETLVERGQHFHLLSRGSLAVSMVTFFRSERRRMMRVLESIKPDLIHAWGTEQGYAYAACDWPGQAILSMQGILSACCEACPQPILMKLQALHERRVLRKINFLTVESDWGRSKLSMLAPNARTELLEYGVDEACYGVDEACYGVERQLAERPLVIFVGTLSTLKGVDVLLRAFADERLKDVDLVLLGDGPLKNGVDGERGNVCFMGHRSPEVVRVWMAKAWCLAHPTLADTSPNAVKEARVMGLPVVTTPNGGQTQYVEHGLSGMIVPAGDHEALADAICAVIKNPETSLKMGHHGQDECREKLCMAATSSKLREILGGFLPELCS